MINRPLNPFTVGLVTALFAFGVSAVAATATNTTATDDKVVELFGDPVIAKGDDIVVKRSELDEAMLNVKSMAASRGQTIPPQYMNTLEQQMLARVIHLKLLLKRATEADKATGKERAQKQYEVLVDRSGSEEAVKLQVKARGMTLDEFKSKLADEATAEVVAERELNVTITDEEAKKYYEENPSRFEEPERVRAAHILLTTVDPVTGAPLSADQKAAKHKLMEDILKRARSGEDFATLVKEYSEDPGSKDNGGIYTFGRGEMRPEFEAAAFTLNTNQISDIVTTVYGYHIIKVLEKLPAKKLTYDEVADDLKEGLKQQAMIKKMPEYMAKLRKEANVEVLDEKLVLKDEPLAESLDEPDAGGAVEKVEEPK